MLLTSFATKAWIVSIVAVFVLILFIRLMWWLGRASENGVVMLVRMGMHTMAREILATLIGYSTITYAKSRYVVWNQVATRFAILWGVVAIALLLASIGWWGAFAFYCTILITGYLLTRLGGSKQTVNRDVNEQRRSVEGSTSLSFIRPWNYLDELYAHQ